MKSGIMKIFGVIFLLSMCINIIPEKTMAATIKDLQNKFPNGAYWNHVVKSGHGYSNYQDYGSCNNPDGYTWTQCNTHNGNVGVGGYDCNSFQNGMQCCGFAKKLAYDLYGSTHTSWGTANIANAKIGDVLHYYGGGADATWGHWVMIIGKSGNTLTFGECNAGGRCKISWGRTLNISSISSYTLYSAPWAATYEVADTTRPTISNVTISDVTADGYTVTCNVSDNVGVTSVKFPSWNNDIHRGEQANWLTGTISGNTATVRVNTKDLKSGAIEGNYLTHIYAYDAAGNSVAAHAPLTYVDRTAPTITEAKIVQQDTQGYTVEVKASDPRGINRVQCPTWTARNGQDDLAGNWETNTVVKASQDGDVYRFRVKSSDHNNEYGTYHTHVYVYDNCGNIQCVNLSTVLEYGMQPQEIIRYGDSLISVFDETLVWNDLIRATTSAGSKLVTITDEDKHNAVAEMIMDRARFRSYYYMGAFQTAKGQPWQWVDGTEFSYTNWGGNQPDCAGNNEFYGSINTSAGTWNDLPNGYGAAGFLMETSLDLQEVNAIEYGDKVYKVYNVALPYKLAQRFCEENGGRLATIPSKKVDELLLEQAALYNRSYFFGLNDIDKEGTFVYTDGTASSYTHWGANEPNNVSSYGGGQDYGVIKPGKYWDDENTANGFIAEFDKEALETPEEPSEPEETEAPQPEIPEQPSESAEPEIPNPSEDTDTMTSSDSEDNGEDIKEIETSESDALDDEEDEAEEKVVVKKTSKVNLKKVRKAGKKKLQVSWKWLLDTNGFEIQLAQNRSFTKKKKTVKVSRWSSYKTVKGLKSKKKYYVRVRAYKIQNGRKVYGSWSTIKSCKVK